MAKTIDDYKRDWAAAKAQNNTAAMAAAHSGAEAIRASQGWSGGADGSQYIVKQTANQTPIGGYQPPVGGVVQQSASQRPTGGYQPTIDSSQYVRGSASQKPIGGYQPTVAPAAFDANTDYSALISANIANSSSIPRNVIPLIQQWFAKTDSPEFAKYRDPAKAAYYQSILDQFGAGATQTPQVNPKDEEIAKLQSLIADYKNNINTYQSPFNQELKSMLTQLQNRPQFQYSPTQDPLYGVYAKEYERRGAQAAEDTLADLSTMTGGNPSSWAVSAAQQARNKYNSELQNIIPQLEQAAYARYQGDYTKDFNMLSALTGLDQNAYSQYADAMNRNVSIEKFLAEMEYNKGRDATANSQWQAEMDYKASRDQVLDDQWLQKFTEDQQQNIIDAAIKRKQISVSEGNLALSRARYGLETQKYADEKAATKDTSHYAGMFQDMIASGDPQGWLASTPLDPAELKWLQERYAAYLSANKNQGTSSGSTYFK